MQHAKLKEAGKFTHSVTILARSSEFDLLATANSWENALPGDSPRGIPYPLTFVNGEEFPNLSRGKAETRVIFHAKCSELLCNFEQNKNVLINVVPSITFHDVRSEVLALLHASRQMRR